MTLYYSGSTAVEDSTDYNELRGIDTVNSPNAAIAVIKTYIQTNL